MPTILDVLALARGERSRTRKLHDAFFEGYLRAHPEAVRLEVDVAKDYRTLPTLDEWDVTAKLEMMYGEGKLDEAAAERWAALEKATDPLHQANIVVVSAPMWNFSIPWFLKRWIDAVVQARLTFEFTPTGYRGLLGGRPAVILASRDGAYAKGSGFEGLDFHVPYLRTMLEFMGLGPVHAVVAEPLGAAGPEVGKVQLEAAVAKARDLGASL